MKMVRRPFGKGPAVSIFTLGTMRALGSKEQMYGVVEAALSAGINHIETAPAYGPAEIFLEAALKQLKHKRIEPPGGWIITSKLLPGVRLAEGKQQLLKMLDRLGLPRINNLAVHGLNQHAHFDWAVKDDGAELLQWAKAEGLVDQIGFSSHGSLCLIEKAIDSGRFDFCSLHLHLLDPERMPLALKAISAGMGVMAISPADKGGHLHTPSPILIRDCNPFPPIKLAYRFLLAAGISTLTLGAFQPKDLEIAKQLMNADGPINESEQKAINQLKTENARRLGTSQCGQCKKCLPCPKGVPIPNLLRLRNIAIGHGLEAFAKERYNLIGKAGHWWEEKNANACEGCGECLPRCPNQLPIPALLADTHQRLAAAPSRRLWG